jgi:hypothetical protein
VDGASNSPAGVSRPQRWASLVLEACLTARGGSGAYRATGRGGPRRGAPTEREDAGAASRPVGHRRIDHLCGLIGGLPALGEDPGGLALLGTRAFARYLCLLLSNWNPYALCPLTYGVVFSALPVRSPQRSVSSDLHHLRYAERLAKLGRQVPRHPQ